MSRQTIAVITLIILLLVAIGFIGYNYYANSRASQDQTIFTQGAQYGYQQAIVQVMQQASTCQQVPLTYNNQTISMIAVPCLQAAQQQQAAAQQTATTTK